MESSLLIRGGHILDPGRGVDTVGDMLIRDGRIAAVGPDIAGETGEVIDAHGLIVCPGLVDIHCHLRDPGFEHKETIETGTRAAAQGGFTTVCCMGNTNPPIDSRATVEYVLRTAAAVGSVRVLPIGCVTRGRLGKEMAELGDLAEAGVVGYSDDGDPVPDAILMRRALEYAGALRAAGEVAAADGHGPDGRGLPIIDHCLEPSLAHEGVMHEGWVAVRLGLRGQPAAAEEALVARDISLAELTGSHVHIAHLSTRGSVDLVRRAKARGAPVTAEATPHHLTLTHELAMSKGQGLAFAEAGPAAVPSLAYDTNAKVNPPLRTREDVEACIEGLRDGTIDCVATDHAPHALEDKLCEFDDAAPGISNFETALASVLSLVHAGKLDMATAIRRMTADPVAVLALDRREGLAGLGSLDVGAPGDVTVFDPNEEWLVEPERFASKGKNTPLGGVKLRGRVVATVSGGKAMWLEKAAGVSR
jgi:dihydroorotase